MNATQEPKYKIENDKIVNRASGEAIPEDEPIMIFRARDRHAIYAIQAYLTHCMIHEHREAVYTREVQFRNFARNSPSKMREPDTILTSDFEATSKPSKPPAIKQPIQAVELECKADPSWVFHSLEISLLAIILAVLLSK